MDDQHQQSGVSQTPNPANNTPPPAGELVYPNSGQGATNEATPTLNSISDITPPIQQPVTAEQLTAQQRAASAHEAATAAGSYAAPPVIETTLPQFMTVQRATPPSSAAPPAERPNMGQHGLRIAGIVLFVFALAAVPLGFWVYSNFNKTPKSPVTTNNGYDVTSVPLEEVADSITVNGNRRVNINGQLTVANSLVLTPSTSPANPQVGQLYLNQTTNNLSYYNGGGFVDLTSSAQLAALSSQITQIATVNSQNTTQLTALNSQVTLLANQYTALAGQVGANSGVLTVAGTTNQVNVSAASGNVVISLPQDIGTDSTPTFGGITISGITTTGLSGTAGTTQVCQNVSGELAACSGGGPASLQASYNASSNPEIVVDATRGALTVRDAATPLGANLLEVQNNTGTATYLAVGAAGTTIATTSATALSVQDASANVVLVVDTQNQQVGIGASPSNSVLTVGGNTNTATGGLRFGSDAGTNLYRSGSNALTTDGSLTVGVDLSVNSGNIITTAATANLLNINATTLNVGGAATSINLGSSAGTTTINHSLAVSGQETVTVTNASAFKVQDASNVAILTADTQNGRLSVGTAAPANSVLTVGTNTTTAAGGITFGNDTSLYRGNANTLSTGGTFTAGGSIISSGDLTSLANINLNSNASNVGYIYKNVVAGTGGVSANDPVVLVNESGNLRAVRPSSDRDPRVYGVAVNSGASGATIGVAISGNTTVTVDTAAVAIGDRLVTTSGGRTTVNNNATSGMVGIATGTKAGGSNGTVSIAVNVEGGQYSPYFRSTSDSASAMAVQNTAGTNIVNVDSTNSRLQVNRGGITTLSAPASVTIGLTSSGGSLANATTYLYKVSAYDGNGETAATASTPASLTTSNSVSLITVNWSAVGGATGYRVYRSTNGGTTWFVSSVTGTSLVDNGTTYSWSGAEKASLEVSGNTILQTTANSTNALQVQNASGDAIFSVDTTNRRVRVRSGNTFTVMDDNGLQVQTNQTAAYTNLGTNGSFDILNLYDASSGGNLVTSVSQTGAALFKNSTNSTNAFLIQSAGGSPTTLFQADTSALTVTVRALTVNVSLTVNGHIITSGSTPSWVVDANAGTGATCSVIGTDTAGTVTINTGSGAWASGVQCSITFSSAYTGIGPKTVIAPTSSNFAAVQPYVVPSTTGMTINFAAAATSATTYTFNYFNSQ